MNNTKNTAETIIKQVRAIEPAISCCISEDGKFITGTYRGKVGNTYKFDVEKNEFIYNNAGVYVSLLYEKVIKG